MKDPFATLQLYADFSSTAVSSAFAAAVRRGVPVGEARHAMDALRDARRREAAAMLAPSMSEAARAVRARPPEPDSVLEFVSMLMLFLGAAADEIDQQLASGAAVPKLRRMVDSYFKPLDGLRP